MKGVDLQHLLDESKSLGDVLRVVQLNFTVRATSLVFTDRSQIGTFGLFEQKLCVDTL
jgi:hypothetical protein